MGAHALLGASSAHRWLECPPSARLELACPTRAAPTPAEGAAVHAYAELELSYRLGHITRRRLLGR
ncbi:MAG: DUF2800 domain-containing protein [Gordonibacter pamelaeae]